MVIDDLEILAGCDVTHPDRRGGQHVAMHCTGVRVLHRPSGVAVTVMSERSQYGNRVKALAALKRLIEPDLKSEVWEAAKAWHATWNGYSDEDRESLSINEQVDALYRAIDAALAREGK